MAIIPITKLEAARRQLETAIRLFAAADDPVSIHVLAFSAHQVLQGLNQKAGRAPMMTERRSLPFMTVLPALPGLGPIEANTVVGQSWAAANFVKHADRDPSDVLDFDDTHAERLLYVACAKHDELAGARTRWTKAFLSWVLAGRPDLYGWSDGQREYCSAVRSIRAETDRRGFFDRVLSMIDAGVL